MYTYEIMSIYTPASSQSNEALGDITVDVLAQAKRMELAMTGQNFLTTVCQAGYPKNNG